MLNLMSQQKTVPFIGSNFLMCSSSILPMPPLNMIGLIHSRLSLFGNVMPNDLAKPKTTGSPNLFP